MTEALSMKRIVANRRRGEVVAVIDSAPRILCLTLGALAELEDAFNVSNLSDLGDYFSQGKFSSEDLVHIIGAGLRGGGNLYADEDVRCMSLDGGALGLAQIAADLLIATFNPIQNRSDEEKDNQTSNPK
ncbi:gene transfer agent family protein [Lentilitoribacter sp. EG35]|uniref:gene transfer agent family protein n=1 Tax=Lentilitoribacter sp. EG35 TaxID=3234192 RepID=UPI00346150AD